MNIKADSRPDGPAFPDPRNTSGMIFNIMRYSVQDGPGVRTTVFLKGCPLECLWCHNPESQAAGFQVVFRADRCLGCGDCVTACPHDALALDERGRPQPSGPCRSCGECVRVCPTGARDGIGRVITVAEAMAEIKKDLPFFEESGGGITFSGGEPLYQPDFLEGLLRACRMERIHTAVDTSGAAPYEILERILPLTDLFLYDLKLMDDVRHKRMVGVSNRLILDNLTRLASSEAEILIRVPIIPGVTDDRENLSELGAFLAELGTIRYIVVLPYHEIGVEKYRLLGRNNNLADTRPPSRERMEEIAAILEGFGLRASIGG